MQSINDTNKELVETFPFLIPRHRLTDLVPANYDYSYTELDDMPEGWRKAFGEQMCAEIMDELTLNRIIDKYRVVQIKEKFGSLRWYDRNGTNKIHNEIIPKYENISARTCIRCGKEAEWISTWWISPYCNLCKEYLAGKENFVPIDECIK